MVAIAVIMPVVLVPYYKKAKKQLLMWDGEDEDVSDIIEEKLSIVQWVSSGALIISYFLLAASYSCGTSLFEKVNSTVGFGAAIIAFLCIMAESIIIQQADSKLAALVYPDFDDAFAHGLDNDAITQAMEENRINLNTELPAYSQIARVKIYPEEFEKTPKKSIKRFLYQEVK